MTLIVDSNEHRNHPEIVPLLQAAGVPCDVGSTNQSPGAEWGYPDFLVFETMTGINRKTVGEWLSNSDKVIDQCQREIAGPIKHLALLIEGIWIAGNGMAESIDFDWRTARLFGPGAHGSVSFARRMYKVNSKHLQNEQTRLEFAGVQVIHTYSLEDTVSKLVAFHDLTLKGEPNEILTRLIKPDLSSVQGLTPAETKFARQLLAFDGVGPELALTIASLGLTTIGALFRYWDDGMILADTLIREKQGVRTRRIGDAAERKLQAAIGYTDTHTSRQDTETGAVPTA